VSDVVAIYISARLMFAVSQTGGHGDGRMREQGECECSGSDSMAYLVDGVPQATHAAREVMRQGAQHVKVHPPPASRISLLTCRSALPAVSVVQQVRSVKFHKMCSRVDKLDSTQLTAEEIRAIVNVVDDMKGTLVTAHAYTSEGIRRAIDNGVRGIEHGNLIDRPTAKLMGGCMRFYNKTVLIDSRKGRVPHSHAHDFYRQGTSAMERFFTGLHAREERFGARSRAQGDSDRRGRGSVCLFR
jgi:hypothetical protein